MTVSHVAPHAAALDSLLVEGLPECNVSGTLGSDSGSGEEAAAGTYNDVVVASIEYRLPPEHKVLINENIMFH